MSRGLKASFFFPRSEEQFLGRVPRVPSPCLEPNFELLLCLNFVRIQNACSFKGLPADSLQ